MTWVFIGLGVMQLLVVILYLVNVLKAAVVQNLFIGLNYSAPVVGLIFMLLSMFKVAGRPYNNKKVYQDQIRVMTIAVLIWSVARLLSCTTNLYLSRIVLGIQGDQKFVAMFLIVEMLGCAFFPGTFALSHSVFSAMTTEKGFNPERLDFTKVVNDNGN